MRKKMINVIGIVLTLLAIFAACLPTVSGQEEKPPGDRERVVIVRPVVLCDNDGSNPAAFELPKKLVDRVYTKADLEFLYMTPRHWSYGEGRQRKVNLDTIVSRDAVVCL